MKQLDDADKIELQYLYDNLGLVLKQIGQGNIDKATDLFMAVQSMVQRSPLFTFDFTAKQAPTKKAGLQPSTPNPAFPEPPKDGGATGHIPSAILKGPSNAEILSHVMERVDRP